MNIKTKTKFQLFAVFISLVLTGNLCAQSVTVPTETVAKGNTAEVALAFVEGSSTTNFDFTLTYNPAVVDEATLTFECDPVIVGLTSLTCAVDTGSNQVRGIGINLSATELSSGVFAVISMPVLADAATGTSVSPFAGNFASDTTVTALDTTWMLKISIGNCNVNMVSGVTEFSDTAYEACEILVLGPNFIAADGASVSVSSGWEIMLMPGFTVEQGATLEANVCGQSLCMTSDSPMPYGCHSCVDQICDRDRFCCYDEFDQVCLDMVDTICGLVCE